MAGEKVVPQNFMERSVWKDDRLWFLQSVVVPESVGSFLGAGWEEDGPADSGTTADFFGFVELGVDDVFGFLPSVVVPESVGGVLG